MKTRALWTPLTFLAIGTAGAAEACGSSSDDVVTTLAPVPDAATEAATVEDASADTEAATDANVAKEGGWVCDPNVDFTDKIPDLPVGNGKTTGECVDCLKADCAGPLKQCNLDCDCQAPMGNLLVCAVSAGFDQTALLGCASNAGFLSTTTAAQTEGFSILTCMQRKCAAECLPEVPDASVLVDNDAGDSGTTDAQ